MIILPQGFKLLSSEPIDARILLTKEEMKDINPNIMPNIYFALCKDDGKLYLYNKNNSFNDITGYFSLYESQPDVDSITQEDIDLIIKKIKEAL